MFKPLFFILLLLTVITSGQTKESNIECVNQKLFGGNCPLKALRDLQENPPEDFEIETVSGIVKISSKSVSAQEESVIRAILGDEMNAQLIADWDTSRPKEKSTSTSKKSFDAFNAIIEITKLAKSKKVVMLNEAHHISQHRVFALKLAKALREVGYTHIAAETFSDVQELNKRQYPTFEDGAYIGDPEFGHFVRTAASLGYKFVNYESGSFDRELGQADNLASFLKQNPKAKLLVYAGYSHIRESVTESGNSWMAKHFRDLTGIDPLTIDQVGGTSHYNPTINDLNYLMVSELINGESKVFSDGDKWLTSEYYNGRVDMTVFHPPETMVDGRASWLLENKDRIVIKTSAQKLPKERPLVLKAVLKTEWEQSGHLAIPVDQVLLNTEEILPLFLPQGQYILKVETWSGKSQVLDGLVSVK